MSTMQHIITPYSRPMEPFVWWNDGFTNQELDVLQDMAKKANLNAEVGSNTGGVVDSSVRRSQVGWLNNTPDTLWIYEKLSYIVSNLNSQFYNFNITGFGECIQLTCYKEADNGMYTWHQDYGTGISRKLSVVVQLSDPSEFEGGELQILTSSKSNNIVKKRGLVTVFPSYTLHQVTPVTKGSRYTLVAWISGPSFK